MSSEKLQKKNILYKIKLPTAFKNLVVFIDNKENVSSTKIIMKETGFSKDMYEKYARELEDMGHLTRDCKKGTNDWTFVFYEKAKTLSNKQLEYLKGFRFEVKNKKSKTVARKKLVEQK